MQTSEQAVLCRERRAKTLKYAAITVSQEFGRQRMFDVEVSMFEVLSRRQTLKWLIAIERTVTSPARLK